MTRTTTNTCNRRIVLFSSTIISLCLLAGLIVSHKWYHILSIGLTSSNPHLQSLSKEYLIKGGRKSVSFLIDGLQDFPNRIDRVYVLSEIGPPAKDALPHLIKMLDDNDKFFSDATFEAIVNIGPSTERDCLYAIIDSLNHKETESNITTLFNAWDLRGFDVSEVVLGFSNLLMSPDCYNCPEIVRACGRLAWCCNWGALEILQSCLSHPNKAIRKEALIALGEVGVSARPFIAELKTLHFDPDLETVVTDSINEIETDLSIPVILSPENPVF